LSGVYLVFGDGHVSSSLPQAGDRSSLSLRPCDELPIDPIARAATSGYLSIAGLAVDNVHLTPRVP
jgi:hypothetical protein